MILERNFIKSIIRKVLLESRESDQLYVALFDFWINEVLQEPGFYKDYHVVENRFDPTAIPVSVILNPEQTRPASDKFHAMIYHKLKQEKHKHIVDLFQKIVKPKERSNFNAYIAIGSLLDITILIKDLGGRASASMDPNQTMNVDMNELLGQKALKALLAQRAPLPTIIPPAPGMSEKEKKEFKEQQENKIKKAQKIRAEMAFGTETIFNEKVKNAIRSTLTFMGSTFAHEWGHHLNLQRAKKTVKATQATDKHFPKTRHPQKHPEFYAMSTEEIQARITSVNVMLDEAIKALNYLSKAITSEDSGITLPEGTKKPENLAQYLFDVINGKIDFGEKISVSTMASIQQASKKWRSLLTTRPLPLLKKLSDKQRAQLKDDPETLREMEAEFEEWNKAQMKEWEANPIIKTGIQQVLERAIIKLSKYKMLGSNQYLTSFARLEGAALYGSHHIERSKSGYKRKVKQGRKVTKIQPVKIGDMVLQPGGEHKEKKYKERKYSGAKIAQKQYQRIIDAGELAVSKMEFINIMLKYDPDFMSWADYAILIIGAFIPARVLLLILAIFAAYHFIKASDENLSDEERMKHFMKGSLLLAGGVGGQAVTKVTGTLLRKSKKGYEQYKRAKRMNKLKNSPNSVDREIYKIAQKNKDQLIGLEKEIAEKLSRVTTKQRFANKNADKTIKSIEKTYERKLKSHNKGVGKFKKQQQKSKAKTKENEKLDKWLSDEGKKIKTKNQRAAKKAAQRAALRKKVGGASAVTMTAATAGGKEAEAASGEEFDFEFEPGGTEDMTEEEFEKVKKQRQKIIDMRTKGPKDPGKGNAEARTTERVPIKQKTIDDSKFGKWGFPSITEIDATDLKNLKVPGSSNWGGRTDNLGYGVWGYSYDYNHIVQDGELLEYIVMDAHRGTGKPILEPPPGATIAKDQMKKYKDLVTGWGLIYSWPAGKKEILDYWKENPKPSKSEGDDIVMTIDEPTQ